MIKKLFCIIIICFWASVGFGANYNVSTGTSTVDGDTFCGGSACTSSDTIIIEGGSRGSILFRDLDGDGSYITIMNEDTNRVVITHSTAPGWGVLNFYNCKYIDVRGDNNSSFAWSSGCKSAECYGILVNNDGSPNTPTGTVWVYGESDHIKLSYIEVDYITGVSGYASSGIKVQDPTLTDAWTFDTFEIHHNYIHDTTYSGMYLGHNRPHDNPDECSVDGSCPYTGNFSIHDNVLEDLGSYGFNLKGSETGSISYIYNNTIRRTGLLNTDPLYTIGIGISYFYGTAYAEIYNNWIEKTESAGMYIREANHLIHHNTIVGCGTNDDTTYGHGISISQWDYMPDRPDRTVEIYNNVIVEPTRYAIYNDGSEAKTYHYKNIIAECGVGEAAGIGLTEGTGSDANVYEADADDLCFTTWSDDSDYSNDDFTLCCAYPYNGSCADGGLKFQGIKIN